MSPAPRDKVPHVWDICHTGRPLRIIFRVSLVTRRLSPPQIVAAQYFGAKETEFLISQTRNSTGRRKTRFLPRFIEQLPQIHEKSMNIDRAPDRSAIPGWRPSPPPAKRTDATPSSSGRDARPTKNGLTYTAKTSVQISPIRSIRTLSPLDPAIVYGAI
jgi:hypothetical protein